MGPGFGDAPFRRIHCGTMDSWLRVFAGSDACLWRATGGCRGYSSGEVLFPDKLLLMPLAISIAFAIMHYRIADYFQTLPQIVFYHADYIHIHFLIDVCDNRINGFFFDHTIVAMQAIHNLHIIPFPINTVVLVCYVVIQH